MFQSGDGDAASMVITVEQDGSLSGTVTGFTCGVDSGTITASTKDTGKILLFFNRHFAIFFLKSNKSIIDLRNFNFVAH